MRSQLYDTQSCSMVRTRKACHLVCPPELGGERWCSTHVHGFNTGQMATLLKHPGCLSRNPQHIWKWTSLWSFTWHSFIILKNLPKLIPVVIWECTTKISLGTHYKNCTKHSIVCACTCTHINIISLWDYNSLKKNFGGTIHCFIYHVWKIIIIALSKINSKE